MVVFSSSSCFGGGSFTSSSFTIFGGVNCLISILGGSTFGGGGGGGGSGFFSSCFTFSRLTSWMTIGALSSLVFLFAQTLIKKASTHTSIIIPIAIVIRLL